MSIESVLSGITHNTRIRCPVCSEGRRKSHEKTMGVTVEHDRILYQCFHCETAGSVRRPTFRKDPTWRPMSIAQPKPIDPPVEVKQDIVTEFLLSRGIDPDKVKDFPIVGADKYFAEGGVQPSIGFLYGDVRAPSAIKWRSVGVKQFTQQGAARSFYGLNQLPVGIREVVICEGEMDVIALAAAGIHAISTPNGAPGKVSDRRVDPSEDGKFSYVWESRELIESLDRVVFFPDNDAPGMALVEELARRIGRAKCWIATLPEKDSNDTLVKHGPEALHKALREARPMPLEGVYLADDFSSEVISLYEKGTVKGVSTGLSNLDNLYTVLPGQLSVVTGMPGSGKSELIDQIMMNIAMQYGWRFAVASFENPPAMHIAKLAEKKVGKPFFGANRMSDSERDSALKFINDHFVFLQSHDGAPATVQSIIDRTRQAVMRMGVRGLVIDPYNYLDFGSDNEHHAISRMLTDVVTFCKAHELHVWFVAHPSKSIPDSGPPKGQHISGSAAWFAKADMGVTVHRKPTEVEVHVWKSRFKWVGTVGMVEVGYEVQTGRYFDIEQINSEF